MLLNVLRGRLGIWIVLAIAACDRGAVTPGDARACESAVKNFWQRSTSAPSTQSVLNAVIASCSETKWSGETLSCMQAATTNNDRNACVAKLTGEQREAMDRAIATTGIAAFSELRDRMCACTSLACVSPLDFEQASLDATMQSARRDPAVKAAWIEIANEATRCFRQHY